jgi:hypothetical protein
MLNLKQRSWLAVDIGGRWIKCVRYEVKGGSIEIAESEVIDIHEEGLLSREEIGAAIGRLVKSAGDLPLVMVLPQASAVSQVVDLPGLSTKSVSGNLDNQISELTGLTTENCIYDCSSLAPFGGYANPRWITLAKEKSLRQNISPLLGQSLRVEAVTTAGNALVAAFRYEHPEIRDAYCVDIGATQTTVIELRRGDPVHMVSLIQGGDAWVKALTEQSDEAFDETESRLFEHDVFMDPTLGPTLQSAVAKWHRSLTTQIAEWRIDSGLSTLSEAEDMPIYLLGGFSRVKGLRKALAQKGEPYPFIFAKNSNADKAPVWQPCLGAVLMATGRSNLKASILPRSLDRIRLRRVRSTYMQVAAMYVLLLAVVVLLAGIVKQNSRLDALAAANEQAEAILVEIQASERLLQKRNALAKRIEPIVQRQLETVEALETFRQVQQVHRDYNFTLVRFVDRETYLQGMDERILTGVSPAFETGNAAEAEQQAHAYVLELMVKGSQAERLQKLGEIVGHLRGQQYFSNVDRWVSDTSSVETMVNPSDEGQTYTLLLTLSDISAPSGTNEAATPKAMKGPAT